MARWRFIDWLLMTGARFGWSKLVSWSLKKGADPFVSDTLGENALFFAVTARSLATVEMLLEHAPSLISSRHFGETSSLVTWSYAMACEPNRKLPPKSGSKGARSVDVFERVLREIDPKTSHNGVLHAAIRAKDRVIVLVCLKAGFQASFQDVDGRTALEVAVEADDSHILETLGSPAP